MTDNIMRNINICNEYKKVVDEYDVKVNLCLQESL